MSRKSDRYASIPEIRQQVFEQWYDEWETPEETQRAEGGLNLLKSLASLRSFISRQSQPQASHTTYSGEQGANALKNA